ncbi:urease accessory protein [Rhizobium sp. BE258]|nr:urease accessory protein [Rhizobium sp. BE258]
MEKKMPRFLTRAAFVLTTFMIPAVASAHTGIGPTSGFVHGFAHPISGIDHTLAMVLVGLLAYQLGGRAIFLVPAAFVGIMMVGGVLGVAGVDLPMVEIGIALSVVVLGAAVALRIKTPTTVAMAVVGLFALFHGHAHGSEMPANATAFTYASGFVAATALLHGLGLVAGFITARLSDSRGELIARTAGGLAALAGLGLAIGLVA